MNQGTNRFKPLTKTLTYCVFPSIRLSFFDSGRFIWPKTLDADTQSWQAMQEFFKELFK